MAKASDNLHKCCACGVAKEPSQFFASKSLLYAGTGRLPICRQCLDRQIAILTDKYKSERKAIQRLCLSFDIFWHEGTYNSVKKAGQSFDFAAYLKKINLVRGGGSKTFEANLEEGFVFGGKDGYDSITKEKTQVSQKLKRFWGSNYEPDEYTSLQEHYDYLDSCNPNRSGNQELFVKELCRINLQKEQAESSKRVSDYKTTSQLYIDTFNQAGLSAKQVIDESEEVTIGTLIDNIQHYTPAEYYADKERYKDYDGLGEYFERFMCRPLMNLATGSSARDVEYFVPDDDDD